MYLFDVHAWERQTLLARAVPSASVCVPPDKDRKWNNQKGQSRGLGVGWKDAKAHKNRLLVLLPCLFFPLCLSQNTFRLLSALCKVLLGIIRDRGKDSVPGPGQWREESSWQPDSHLEVAHYHGLPYESTKVHTDCTVHNSPATHSVIHIIVRLIFKVVLCLNTVMDYLYICIYFQKINQKTRNRKYIMSILVTHIHSISVRFWLKYHWKMNEKIKLCK